MIPELGENVKLKIDHTGSDKQSFLMSSPSDFGIGCYLFRLLGKMILSRSFK